MPPKRGAQGQDSYGVWPQPTGTTFSQQHELAPPRLIGFGTGSGSGAGTSREGSWAPPPISNARGVLSPMQTGLSGMPGSAAAFAGMTSVHGGGTSIAGGMGGGGPGTVNLARTATGTSSVPGGFRTHPRSTVKPQTTGGTALSGFPGPGAGQAPSFMAPPGADPSVAPQFTGAPSQRSGGVRGHMTGATAMSGFPSQGGPPGGDTGGAPSFMGAPTRSVLHQPTGATHFSNFPPPADPSVARGPSPTFVGAPTRMGAPDSGSGDESLFPVPQPFVNPASPNAPAASPGGAPPAAQPKKEEHPMSKTMKYAAELPSAELRAAVPKGKTLSDAKIKESRGQAMVDATRAFYGKHRPASQRFVWSLPTEHDERVTSLMDWIDRMHWALAKHGMNKFLETKKRGALMVNAGYISPYHLEEPVFDWLTFDRAQGTGDRILQESIATYDPATTVMLFVYLVSESYNSVAMWRRQLTLPPSVQLQMNLPIEKLKADLRKTTNIIHITSPALWTGPPAKSPQTSTSTSPRSTVSKPPPVTEIIRETVEVVPAPKKKKPKWWQFWKRMKITW